MIQTYTITLPYPPTINTMWATVRGRRVLSTRGRAYRTMVGQLCLVAGLPRPLPAPVSVHVAVCPPDKRLRDLDNLFKSIGDALQEVGVLRNDADIDDLHLVRRAVDRPAGHVVLTIETGDSDDS